MNVLRAQYYLHTKSIEKYKAHFRGTDVFDPSPRYGPPSTRHTVNTDRFSGRICCFGIFVFRMEPIVPEVVVAVIESMDRLLKLLKPGNLLFQRASIFTRAFSLR